jgi:hypothetical protein
VAREEGSLTEIATRLDQEMIFLPEDRRLMAATDLIVVIVVIVGIVVIELIAVIAVTAVTAEAIHSQEVVAGEDLIVGTVKDPPVRPGRNQKEDAVMVLW